MRPAQPDRQWRPVNAPRQRLPLGLSILNVALAMAAGSLHALSMAWPDFAGQSIPGLPVGQPVWWLELVSLAALAWLLQRCAEQPLPNWRAGSLYGGMFACAWFSVVFGWTFVAMHTYGGLPAVPSALAVLALASFLASYYAAVCGAFVFLVPFSPGYSAALFSALWLLAELARGVWLTGFSWGATAYAHPDGPLANYAPWLGAYGVGALAAWLAMVLAQLAADRTWRPSRGHLISALLVLSLPTIGPMLAPDRTQSSGRLMVTLLQGNIPQDEKFESGSGVPLALQWYGEQLRQAQSALVVAPETALPLLPHQLPSRYWAELQARFASGAQAALIGIPLGSFEEGYTNSVVGLRPGADRPWRYDKHHLVPFGEFIPPWFKWFTELMNIPLGDFNRGGLGQPTFLWQGQRIAANICYEDLFGEELAHQFRDAAQAPTMLVNLSNLAWFGSSMAMDHHLQIARWRALEFARPFLLSTNTGVTAIVDHQARVLQTLPRDTRGVLVGEVEGRTGLTPYAWWVARLGLWPYWLLGLAMVLASWRWHLRKR